MISAKKAVSYFLLVVGVVCLVLVAALAWHGEKWNVGPLSVSSPKDRLIIGAVTLLLWYMLRSAAGKGAKAWAAASARVALLAASMAISLFASERLIRGYLRHTQGFNSLENLKAHEEGKLIRSTAHKNPMVHIIRLSKNKKLVFELKRDQTIDFGHRTVKLNSVGMRESAEYPIERKPSSVRIVGLGDSGMWGWGVEQDEDAMAVLEVNLNQRSTGVLYEVLNLAVPAYCTQQEVEMLRWRGLAYKPDVVVVWWCWNDTSLPSFLYEHRKFDEKDVSYLYEYLFDRKRYFQLIAPRVNDRTVMQKRALVDPAVREYKGWDGVRKALTELDGLSKEHGFKVLIFGPMGEDIIAVCKEMGFEYYSTREAIPEDRYPKKEYGVHWMHPRKKGHAVLAEHIEKALESRGWLKVRQ